MSLEVNKQQVELLSWIELILATDELRNLGASK